MGGYRRDIDAARRRLAGCESRVLRDPRFRDIEYTEWGEGLRCSSATRSSGEVIAA